MVNVEKYLEETEYGIMVKRSEILTDIRKGVLGYYDIYKLCDDERISSQFFTSGRQYMLDDTKKINEKHVDMLFWMNVSEEFNLPYLIYFKMAVDSAAVNKKKRRENIAKGALTFAGGLATGVGGMLIGKRFKK